MGFHFPSPLPCSISRAAQLSLFTFPLESQNEVPFFLFLFGVALVTPPSLSHVLGLTLRGHLSSLRSMVASAQMHKWRVSHSGTRKVSHVSPACLFTMSGLLDDSLSRCKLNGLSSIRQSVLFSIPPQPYHSPASSTSTLYPWNPKNPQRRKHLRPVHRIIRGANIVIFAAISVKMTQKCAHMSGNPWKYTTQQWKDVGPAGPFCLLLNILLAQKSSCMRRRSGLGESIMAVQR